MAAGRLSILTPKRGVDLCIFFGPTEILVNESSVRVPFVYLSFLLGNIANNPTLQFRGPFTNDVSGEGEGGGTIVLM